MITVINQTNKKFNLKRGVLKEGRENRSANITFEKMHLEVFLKDSQLDSLEKIFSSTGQFKPQSVDVPNNRLYFSNKHYRPISVGNSKSRGADFLLVAQSFEHKERLVSVDHSGAAFVLQAKIVKDKYLSAVISFRVNCPSSVIFITVVGGKFKYSEYRSDGKGNVTSTIIYKPVETVKHLNTDMRSGVKPFRPFKATHLVFTNERDKNDADSLLGPHNHTIVEFKNTSDLKTKIDTYRMKGFTAGTLFVPIGKDEQLSPIETANLNAVVNSFKVAHLTYGTGYTLFKSLKSVGTKAPKESNNKTTPPKGVKRVVKNK